MPISPRASLLYSAPYRRIIPAAMLKPRALAAASFFATPSESLRSPSRNGKLLRDFQLSSFLGDRKIAASIQTSGQPAFMVDSAFPQSSSWCSWSLGGWHSRTSRSFSTSPQSASKKHGGIADAIAGTAEPEADGSLIENEVSICNDRIDASGAESAEFDGKVETDSVVDRETDAATAAGRARERRRRPFGASFARPATGPLPDLLIVPGIGPRNMQKLVAKGIERLAELKQLYRDKFRDDGSDKMVEFLQSSVGILHKHHAASITSYIKDKVEAELAPKDDRNPPKKRLTFCVEGNISVGKSTFLQKIASETLELQDLVEIVPEPVAKWQDVGANHFNILESFYKDPERYAYTFQNYVFVTRLMQERESAHGVKPLRLMERSVFSDRMVFVRAVHEAKWMSEMEISIYDSWFNPVVSELPGLVPDAFIYLRASPDTCLQRLLSRKRPEEQGVSLDYLQGLHEKHEQWLLPAQTSGGGGVLSLSPALREPMSPRIRDRVFYLEGDHVHSCIQKVPALMLDCDANIDFSKDVEAKAEYARQVAEFFEYVQRTKDNQTAQGSQLVLPRSGGVLGPAGAHLLGNAPLNATDLSRRMSALCV